MVVAVQPLASFVTRVSLLWHGQVLTDLLAWWPKMRPGGLFAGHDFRDLYHDGSNSWEVQPDGSSHPEWKAVRGAVLDFAELVNRQVTITYEDPKFASWIIRK